MAIDFVSDGHNRTYVTYSYRMTVFCVLCVVKSDKKVDDNEMNDI